MRFSTKLSRSPTSTTKAELRDFAESPAAYTPPPPGFVRLVDERYVIFLGPTPEFTNVQRPRLAGDVEQALGDIRRFIKQHGHRKAEWWIGPTATPRDLTERLVELGLQPHEHEPELTAMVLEHVPADPPPDITARSVETEKEMAEAVAIQSEVFAASEAEREQQLDRAAERFRIEQKHGLAKTFLAWVDGKPAAAGLAVFAPQGVLLAGGCTRPCARGRGAYRALVRARWDAAVDRGTPTLVIQASSMSAPIVRRLGFVELFRIRQLVDLD